MRKMEQCNKLYYKRNINQISKYKYKTKREKKLQAIKII